MSFKLSLWKAKNENISTFREHNSWQQSKSYALIAGSKVDCEQIWDVSGKESPCLRVKSKFISASTKRTVQTPAPPGARMRLGSLETCLRSEQSTRGRRNYFQHVEDQVTVSIQSQPRYPGAQVSTATQWDTLLRNGTRG